MLILEKICRFSQKSHIEKFYSVKTHIQRLHLFVTQKIPDMIHKNLTARMLPPQVFRSRIHKYVSFRPDSDFYHDAHPELIMLSEHWVANNALNNSGDLPRLYALVLNIKQVIVEGVVGDLRVLTNHR